MFTGYSMEEIIRGVSGGNFRNVIPLFLIMTCCVMIGKLKEMDYSRKMCTRPTGDEFGKMYPMQQQKRQEEMPSRKRSCL